MNISDLRPGMKIRLACGQVWTAVRECSAGWDMKLPDGQNWYFATEASEALLYGATEVPTSVTFRVEVYPAVRSGRGEISIISESLAPSIGKLGTVTFKEDE